MPPVESVNVLSPKRGTPPPPIQSFVANSSAEPRFVDGCMCLRGSAKTLDLALLLCEQKKAKREKTGKNHLYFDPFLQKIFLFG